MTRKPAQPSLMSRGAPASGDEPEPLALWWRDRLALLQAVHRHASEDPLFARQVVQLLANMAKGNRRLRSEFEEAVKAPAPGQQNTPASVLYMLLDTYEDLTRGPCKMPSEAAKEHLSQISKTAWGKVPSIKAVERLLTKARKLRAEQA